jgi:hypothetical protein
MAEIYFRLQRATIYDPATIDDLPFEVLKKCLGYLLPRGRLDLVASSSVRRSWRPPAQELLRTLALSNEARIESSLCGLLLHSIVDGFKSFSIKNLTLDLHVIGIDYIPMIVRFVAPTLSSLYLTFIPLQSSYSILDAFFSQCFKLVNLFLAFFDFGDDPEFITQPMKDGFAQLKRLRLSCSCGNAEMFMREAPIRDLKTFTFVSARSWLRFSPSEYDIISIIAMNNRSLSTVRLEAPFNSSDNLLKLVECCPDLESVSFQNFDNGSVILKRSDLESIATLPLLKVLDVNCAFEEGALSALVGCKMLYSLLLGKVNVETFEGIIEYFPNLVVLELEFKEDQRVKKDHLRVLKQKFKNGLGRLARLKVNGVYYERRIL